MRLLLPLLAGILAFASFPKIDQGYLAWISTSLIAMYIFGCRTARTAFWGGLLAGIVERGVLLIWIPPVMTLYGGLPRAAAWGLFVPLIAMLALFPAAVCMATRFLMNRLGEKLLLVFPLIWVGMEYALTYVPFGGFPWLLAGYSQTKYLPLIQVADLTGIYGVSFLLLWFNTSLAWACLKGKRALLPLSSAVILVAASLLYGWAAIRHWDGMKADRRVAMLQENISIDDDWQTLRWKAQEGYARMADGMGTGHADLLILPEAPSPVSYERDSEYREAMRGLAARFDLGLIFSNVAYEEVAGEPRYYNSAYFMDRGGGVVGRYDKIHLVPFGEYIPLARFFRFVQTITKDVGGFDPGSQYRAGKLGEQPINAIICFEAVFPQIEREFARRGSRLIVNLTNDRWYGKSAAPYQHLLMSRWRAIENRRYLLRATNSGISAVIDPLGRIRASTGLLTEDICTGRFEFISESTLYTRHGDWFAIVCAMITVSFFIVAFVVHLFRRS